MIRYMYLLISINIIIFSNIGTTISGHSTHFQVGGDNPKVEGQEFSSLPQGPVKGPFPN
jgi:hypothetical protein